MTGNTSSRALADIFKALADETRLRMIALLFERRELCVCHFERALEIGQSTASRHLRYLLNAGLVEDRREGVWMHHRLADDPGVGQSLILDALRQNLDPAVREDLRRRLEYSLAGETGTADTCCPVSASNV